MQSVTPVISFAIPTYNFGPYLASTVHSIYKGATHLQLNEIEVVIVDGASSDETPEVAEQLKQQYAGIRYVRMHKRGGIDFDLNHAVNLCSAQYIWLLSADDVLESGWDRMLLRAIERDKPDLILVSATLCSVKMEPLRKLEAFDIAHDEGARLFDWASPNMLEEYLSVAKSLEALFSYMSAVVVRRQAWIDLPEREDYYGSCWAHCARLLPLLTQTQTPPTKLLYLNAALINKRTGNDSFMEQGFINRLAITVNGWCRLAQEYFSAESHRSAVYRLMYQDSSWLNLAYAKLGAKNAVQTQQVLDMAHKIYAQGLGGLGAKLLLLSLHCMPSWPRLQRYLHAFVPWIAYMRHKLKGYLR